MKLDAMKRQGQRTDLTFSPTGKELHSHEKLMQDTGESKNQIFRFIRLTHLTPELLAMTDNAVLAEKDQPQIALRPAVELSYLPEETQQWVVAAIAMEDATPNHAQAIKMRKFFSENQLNEAVVLSIMQEEKPNQMEKIKIPREKISRFFSPDASTEKIMATIIQALEHLQRSRMRPKPNPNRDDHGAR